MQNYEDFLRERIYLKNVSPSTVSWYRASFQWLARHCPDEVSKEGLRDFVVGMREAGLSAASCNNRIRAVKAYLAWAELPFKLSYLKEEQKVLAVFTPEQLALLIRYKPRGLFDRRLHTLVLLLLDTGIRIEEALTLQREKVDFDNLLLTVRGKGNKERTIPFSVELRKSLWRYCKEQRGLYLFATRNGTRLSKRNVLRDFKAFCRRLGFEPPRRSLHALRHTFSVNYLRAGGNLFYLSKQLGHSTTRTTEGYLRAVQPHDLGVAHQKLSLLNRL